MELWESRVEIAPDAAEATELALLESGFGGWSLLEDAVAKRAWIVGIFQGEAEAVARWSQLSAALRVQSAIAPLGNTLTSAIAASGEVPQRAMMPALA